MAIASAPPAISSRSEPSRPTKIRSSTGCISQARAAVLPAAIPISKKATAIRGACGRMNSCAKRHTSAAVCAPPSRIGGFLSMVPAGSVKDGDTPWQGWRLAGLASRTNAAQSYAGYETKHLSDAKMCVST